MGKVCDALLDFPDKTFVMCEKELGHEGNHRGLFFEWIGEGTSHGSQEDANNGKEAMRFHLENIISERD